MTAIEKAKELVKKYSCLNRGELENDWKNKDIVYDSLDIECALIAVDTVLWMASHYATIDYWNEVKQEIEKL
jgi:hypothetical protein